MDNVIPLRQKINKFRFLIAYAKSHQSPFSIVLALIIGLGTGLGAVGFRWLLTNFHALFFNGGRTVLGFMGDSYVILIPAVGGLLVGPIVYFFAREAKGHGVPEVMLAVATDGGRIRSRVALVKSLASAICIGSGGSVGREGPIVQIGASIGSSVAQRLKLPEEWLTTFVACGAAGGISATFNAPLAGVFFAMEVILGRFIPRPFGLVVLSSVVAAMISQFFLGNSPAFVAPQYQLISSWELPLYFLLGIIAAVFGYVFVTVLYRTEDMFDALKIPEYLKPVIGGFGLGIMGLFYPQLFGVGYDGGINFALVGSLTMTTLLALAFLKIIATSLTLGSGGSGGVFAPSLFIGAMLGGIFGIVVNELFPGITAPPGAYSLVGMAAVFGGAARAPITAIIILFEMTRDYSIILPLMTAVVVSTLLSRAMRADSIYTLKISRRGVDLGHRDVEDVLRTISVGDVMTAEFPSVNPETTLSQLTDSFTETGHHGFPVVTESGNLFGIVTLSDTRRAINKNTTVRDFCTRDVIVAYPEQSLHDALAQFGSREVGRIPVVENNSKKLVGVLRRHDIISAYIARVQRPQPNGVD